MTYREMTNLALRYDRFGPPREVLEAVSLPMPESAPGRLLVEMILAPINPSDLIPITGAYSHLIKPPMIAGYEGVGRVVEAPEQYAHLVGQRVLPLRGDGTWQRFLQCDPEIAVPVPDMIPDDLAARGYINPLTASYLLREWPVAGKRVILTGAGSFIAAVLAQWAQQDGAREVIGIYRSPERREVLAALGVVPVHESDSQQIAVLAQGSEITFDAVGGAGAMAILNAMPKGAECVGYGLLSGQSVFPNAQTQANLRRFRLRDRLKDLSPTAWQDGFKTLWPRLAKTNLPGIEVFEATDWRKALDAFDRPGRAGKPLLRFSEGS